MPASFSVQPIVELSRPIDAIDKEALIFLSTLRVNGLTTSDVLNVISRMFFWVFSDLDEKTMTDVFETMEGKKKMKGLLVLTLVLLSMLFPTITALAEESPFPVQVDIFVTDCAGAPLHDAHAELQFDNGQRWIFKTDEAGEVHEIVVPNGFAEWRLGVNGLWGEWRSSTWVDETVKSCWVHMPVITKG